MRSLHIRGRPSIAQLISIALAGLCIGLFVGFGFMSAAETVSSAARLVEASRPVLGHALCTIVHCRQVLTTRAEVRNEEKQLPGTEAELIGGVILRIQMGQSCAVY